MKIYLIDDDSEEAELFSEAVKRIDSSIDLVWCDVVSNAFEQLVNDQNLPAAIFIDLNIPQVSGKTLLKMLRENSITENIPVVIYSTSISKKDMSDTLPYNVSFYLEKPENFSALCEKLSDVLNKVTMPGKA